MKRFALNNHQGLFALVAARRTYILPLALLRHMLRMGGSVGGGEIKRQGIYVSPLPAFLEPAIARLPKALASLRAPLSLLTRAF